MIDGWPGVVFVDKQLVEDQAVRLLALTPEHHQNDDFEFVVTSYSFHYSVPDHCVCPVERLYSAGEVCEYCISVAFFDDPDYAKLLGYVLVDDKWVLNNTWTVPPLDNPPTEDGTLEAGGK